MQSPGFKAVEMADVHHYLPLKFKNLGSLLFRGTPCIPHLI